MNNQNPLSARDGANKSFWQEPVSQQANAGAPAQSELNQIFDVLIIGGGITGLTTALNLQRAGKKCILCEAHNLGYGTTGGTTAHLNTFFDATYPEIDSDFSEEASRQLAQAAAQIITKIKSNIDELNIDADFEYKKGFLFAQNDKETKELQQILASSQKAGVQVEESATNGLNIPFQQAIVFDNQAQFHPLKYILGLADGFKKLGGIILEQTAIQSTELRDDIHIADLGQFNIQSKALVWATHIPPGINLLSLRNAPYRSYVLAVSLADGQYPEGLSYDMQEPYHYFRSHKKDGKNYLIIGGADHKTGHNDPEQAFAELEKYARANFNISSVDYKWSSQYYVPVDGLPYIGTFPGSETEYLATGFNGNGMILGSLSGQIISDLIMGIDNPLQQMLKPSRLKPISGFTEFIKENADVAFHFVADRFSVKMMESTAEIKENSGKVVSFEGQKLAVYKDANGKVTTLNPVCTHAGCIVNWNDSEKSWDCPCHGGRFSPQGEVLTGPPTQPLKEITVPEID